MKKLLLLLGILFFSIAIQAQIVVNNDPYPLIECDDNNDGFALFNLHEADADITLGDPSLVITYHITLMDAENSTNALISPYMNTVPRTDLVYARVMDNQDVFAIVELELQVVDDLPVTQPNDLFLIDEDNDGVEIFDLTENDAVVLGGLNPAAFMVSYYESLANAEIGEFAITTPTAYMNIQSTQTIYVRTENMSGSCVAISSFTISVLALSVDSFHFKDLIIFPNPTSGTVSIKSSQLVSEITISFYDILGRMVLSETTLPQNGTVRLDVSYFSEGVYFVKISSEGNEAVRKLIKQ